MKGKKSRCSRRQWLDQENKFHVTRRTCTDQILCAASFFSHEQVSRRKCLDNRCNAKSQRIYYFTLPLVSVPSSLGVFISLRARLTSNLSITALCKLDSFLPLIEPGAAPVEPFEMPLASASVLTVVVGMRKCGGTITGVERGGGGHCGCVIRQRQTGQGKHTPLLG